MENPPEPTTRALLATLVPDVVAIVMFGALSHAGLLDAKIATGLMLTVLTARAYGVPPKGGGGASPPPAGVATLAIALLVLLDRFRGAASTPHLEIFNVRTPDVANP